MFYFMALRKNCFQVTKIIELTYQRYQNTRAHGKSDVHSCRVVTYLPTLLCHLGVCTLFSSLYVLNLLQLGRGIVPNLSSATHWSNFPLFDVELVQFLKNNVAWLYYFNLFVLKTVVVWVRNKNVSLPDWKSLEKWPRIQDIGMMIRKKMFIKSSQLLFPRQWGFFPKDWAPGVLGTQKLLASGHHPTVVLLLLKDPIRGWCLASGSLLTFPPAVCQPQIQPLFLEGIAQHQRPEWASNLYVLQPQSSKLNCSPIRQACSGLEWPSSKFDKGSFKDSFNSKMLNYFKWSNFIKLLHQIISSTSNVVKCGTGMGVHQ